MVSRNVMKKAGTLKYSVELLLERASSSPSLLEAAPSATPSSLSAIADTSDAIEAKQNSTQMALGKVSLMMRTILISIYCTTVIG